MQKLEISDSLKFNENPTIYSGYYKETLLPPDNNQNISLNGNTQVEWTSISGSVPFIPSKCYISGNFSSTHATNTLFVFLKKILFQLQSMRLDSDFSNGNINDIKDANIWNATKYDRNNVSYDAFDAYDDFGGRCLMSVDTATEEIQINNNGSFKINLAKHFGGFWNISRNCVIPDGLNLRLTFLDKDYWGFASSTDLRTTKENLSTLTISNLRLSLYTQLDQSIISNMNMQISKAPIIYPYETINSTSVSFGTLTSATITQKLIINSIGSRLKDIYVLVVRSDADFKTIGANAATTADILINSIKPTNGLQDFIRNIKVTIGNDILIDNDISKGQYSTSRRATLNGMETQTFLKKSQPPATEILSEKDILCVKIPLVNDIDNNEGQYGRELGPNDNCIIEATLSQNVANARLFAYFVGYKKIVVSSLGTQIMN